MKITELHMAATTANHAIARRAPGASSITVELITPGRTTTHDVTPDDKDDIWSMAEILHEALEGVRGTNGDIFPFYAALESMSDL